MLTLDDPANQIEAQSDAAARALVSGLQLPEPVEGALDVLRPDADAPVRYTEPDRPGVRTRGQLDLYPFWGVFTRIGHQFRQYRRETGPITPRLRQRLRQRHGQGLALLGV